MLSLMNDDMVVYDHLNEDIHTNMGLCKQHAHHGKKEACKKENCEFFTSFMYLLLLYPDQVH